MRRNTTCGRAMTALLLIGMLATASAVHIRSPSFRRSLLANPPAPAPTTSLSYRATDSPATLSGLQDAPFTGTTPVLVGHYLTNAGLMASTAYSAGFQTGGQKAHSNTVSTGTWGQEISYSAVDSGNGDTRSDIFEDKTVLYGITIDSVKLRQKSNIWMMDTNQGNVYKLDTLNSGTHTTSVTGVYQSSPAGAMKPIIIAVDSNGDAWVANINVAGFELGSVVKIKSSGCTGSSGNTLFQGTWSGTTSNDGCVVQYTSLDVNTVTISSLAIDGADNLWILAVNSYTGSASTNFLNIYKVPKSGSTATLMYGPLTVPGGAFGSPGGNGAVVDKYGFLWTGSGAFLYDGAGTYTVLRFDTSIATPNDAAKPVLAIAVSDEANALNLDSDSNLWVAGGAHVTKIFTDATQITAATGTITATLGGGSISIALSTSALSDPITLSLVAEATLATACATNPADGCCTEGNFDMGIAITRDTVAAGDSLVPSSLNTIYVANACDTGLVFPISNVAGTGTPTIGDVLVVGSNLQTIAADHVSNIWLASTVVTDEGVTNDLFVITKGTNTVNVVSGYTLAAGASALNGFGDLTGYITAQPTQIATYTYLHDTAITSYAKWDLGSIGWTFDSFGTSNGLVGGAPMYTVTAQAGNNYAALMALSTLSYNPTVTDTTIPAATLGAGRYLRVDVQLTRSGKVAPLVGPQGYGTSPTLTEIRVLANNHDPSARCRSVYVSATDDSVLDGGVGGAYGNAVAGVCTQGAPISIDNTSFDSDTQEADGLITTGTTTGTIISYKSTDHINSLPTYVLETSYSTSQLTVTDHHGYQATCTATVAIWDDSPPTFIAPTGSDIKLKADSPSAPALCVWPPNVKFYCLLDIFSQAGGRFIQTNILPVRDNCGAVSGFQMTVDAARTSNGATPTIASGKGFSCIDTDPRSQPGDCTLTEDSGKHHFCVKAHRRTVFTNLDRVFTMRFLVQDAGTQQGLNSGTLFTRSLRVPAIWNFYAATNCPRASYASAADTRA